MTHSPSSEPAPEEVPEEEEHLDRSAEPQSTTSTSKSSRWITYAALALAVIAVALGVVALLRPAHHNASPKFTDQQTADAKTNVCSAYSAIHQAVVVNTHMANPVPNDPIGQLSVAANARLALLGGGSYLRDRLAAEPATPADLAKAVTAMSDTIEQLGVGYLAGLKSTLGPLRQDLDKEIAQLDGMCA